MSEYKKRDSYIDILKGIGITSVVLGHAFNTNYYFSHEVNFVRKFVYIYHLVIFFYVNGFLYKERDIKSFYKGIIKNLYLKSTIFSLLSFLLVPLFYSLHVLQKRDFTLKNFTDVLRFHPERGIFTGPLWFVTWLAVSMALFDITMRLTNNNELKRRRLFIFLCLGIVGIILINLNVLPQYFFNRSLIVLPIMYLGFLSREKKVIDIFKKKLMWLHCFIFGFIILILNYFTGMEIEISKNLLYGIYGFYPMSLLGILFCLSLANVLKNNKIGYTIAYIGKNSFNVMAMHVWIFKLFDGIMGNIIGISEVDLARFPISFSSIYFRFIYFVLGVVLPLFFVYVINKFKKLYLRSKLK